jgi:hypothetical protein
VNFGKRTAVEAEFDALSTDEEIEKELQALKTPPVSRQSEPQASK